jgi:PEP-CTERM motif
MKPRFAFSLAVLIAVLSPCVERARAQSVLFDFNNAPLHSPLPLDLTVDGITAHFSSSSLLYNYSIQQPSDVIGFTPAGFSGYAISPSTINASDLLISFGSTLLTDLSIMYAPEEYATDSSCTMRISAYLGASFVGTSTFSIDPPGTWPTGTLSFSSAQPFDNVVIHYDAPPVTGGDYGPIFMADNLAVTPAPIPEPASIVMVVVGLGFLLGALRCKQQASLQD